jgi:hypothetical protein
MPRGKGKGRGKVKQGSGQRGHAGRAGSPMGQFGAVPRGHKNGKRASKKRASKRG